MVIQENEMYTIEQAAWGVGLTYHSIYKYIRSKRLPASKMGGIWVVKGSDLLAFDASRKARVGA